MSCVIEMEVLVLGAGSERRQVGITANSEYYFWIQSSELFAPARRVRSSVRQRQVEWRLTKRFCEL